MRRQDADAARWQTLTYTRQRRRWQTLTGAAGRHGKAHNLPIHLSVGAWAASTLTGAAEQRWLLPGAMILLLRSMNARRRSRGDLPWAATLLLSRHAAGRGHGNLTAAAEALRTLCPHASDTGGTARSRLEKQLARSYLARWPYPVASALERIAPESGRAPGCGCPGHRTDDIDCSMRAGAEALALQPESAALIRNIAARRQQRTANGSEHRLDLLIHLLRAAEDEGRAEAWRRTAARLAESWQQDLVSLAETTEHLIRQDEDARAGRKP